MSPINSISSSTASKTAAIYQERLADQLAAKQSAKLSGAQVQPQAAATPAPVGDVDGDGDSH